LLQLAAKREDVRAELVDEHVLPLLAAKLRALLRDKSSADIDAALRAMSIDELSYVDDLFRCCFIVTVPWGPAGSARQGSTRRRPQWSRTIRRRCLKFSSTRDSRCDASQSVPPSAPRRSSCRVCTACAPPPSAAC
jgi:hypothetical protein